MSENEMSQSETSEHFDKPGLMHRLGDDTDLMQELLDYAEEDFPVYLQSLHDALESGDTEALRRAAHKLKGFARNLAFTRLAQLALEAEHTAKAQETAGAETVDTEAARSAVAAIQQEIDTLSGLIAGQ